MSESRTIPAFALLLLLALVGLVVWSGAIGGRGSAAGVRSDAVPLANADAGRGGNKELAEGDQGASVRARVDTASHQPRDPGPGLVPLGPLDEPGLAECRRRMTSMLDLYRRKRLEHLSQPIPDEASVQDLWREEGLRSHYLCLKSELAAQALDAGDYWVFEPGTRRLPSDIRSIELYGVKALGRDNVTVVIPLSLREHPQLEDLGTDWEELLRVRARLFTEEFNRRSHDDRVAAIARNDDTGRRLQDLNARSTRDGLTEAEVTRIEAEHAEVKRDQFPRYCIVDRDRQMLYVWERGR